MIFTISVMIIMIEIIVSIIIYSNFILVRDKSKRPNNSPYCVNAGVVAADMIGNWNFGPNKTKYHFTL